MAHCKYHFYYFNIYFIIIISKKKKKTYCKFYVYRCLKGHVYTY